MSSSYPWRSSDTALTALLTVVHKETALKFAQHASSRISHSGVVLNSSILIMCVAHDVAAVKSGSRAVS